MSSNLDSVKLLALSAQGVATLVSADQENFNWRGLTLISDLTVAGGTPACTITIQGKDPVSGKYYTLLASSSIAATATNVLSVYPGIAASANVAASAVLPKTWRVQVAITGGTPSYTGTVSATLHV